MKSLCAYCVITIYSDEPAETRGSFRVHKWCQIVRERETSVYLLRDGSLQVRAHVIEPKLARAIVLHAIETNLATRRRLA